MTDEELRALVAELARDRRRFTLEDAGRGDGDGDGWVAYLFEHRPNVTYRVTDYTAYHAEHAYLPADWITREPRPARNGGRDYSEEEAALTLADIGRLLGRDAGARSPLRALHIRYADDGNHPYRVVVATPTGPRACATRDAYLRLQNVG